MEHWKSVQIDTPEMWPTESMVELDEPHVDARGSIQSLVNLPMKNISLITSVKGSLRSNHYHQTDWHYIYMLSGSCDYYYRLTDSDDEAKILRVSEGDLIFTPPMEDHTTVFLEDSAFLAMSRNARDQESYESDVKRVILVDPSNYIL